MSSSAARRLNVEEKIATRPELPVLHAQPIVVLYNTPRSSEVTVRKALKIIEAKLPSSALLISRNIQMIEIGVEGGRIYLDQTSQGVVELGSMMEGRSLAWIGSYLVYAAQRIEKARRGETETSLHSRVIDLKIAVAALRELGGTAEELRAERANLEALAEFSER